METVSKEIRVDGRLRLPPGQRLTDGWPVLHYGSIPRIDLDNWQFHAWGLVEKEQKWNWEEFNALGTIEDTSDIHCVTTWSKYDNTWEGIPFEAFLEKVKPTAAAKYVMVHSYGGYTTNIPLADLKKDGVLFAHSHNGKPLEKEHGWPLRLIVPELYFWKSAKWIGGIQFLDEDRAGFWETYGYHIYGDPWQEQRYS